MAEPDMPDPDAIDLIELEPGVYGLKPVDPHAHQWEAFWRSLITLLVFVGVGVAIDLLTNY